MSSRSPPTAPCGPPANERTPLLSSGSASTQAIFEDSDPDSGRPGLTKKDDLARSFGSSSTVCSGLESQDSVEPEDSVSTRGRFDFASPRDAGSGSEADVESQSWCGSSCDCGSSNLEPEDPESGACPSCGREPDQDRRVRDDGRLTREDKRRMARYLAFMIPTWRGHMPCIDLVALEAGMARRSRRHRERDWEYEQEDSVGCGCFERERRLCLYVADFYHIRIVAPVDLELSYWTTTEKRVLGVMMVLALMCLMAGVYYALSG